MIKIKKIIPFILVCILILSLIPVSAEDDTIITSIKDGDLLSESPESITISVAEGDNVLVLLDGVEIADFISEGSDTVELTKELEVGKHKLVTIARNDVDTFVDVAEFEVTYTGIDTGSTIYTNQEKIIGIDADKVSKEAGTDKDGSPLTISKALFDGKDGESGGAVGFKTSGILADITGAKHIHIPLYWNKTTLSGILNIEYDIKIEGQMRFEFETSGSAGYGNFGPDNMINKGKIAGKVEYEQGQWYHIKHVVNFDTKKQDLYVDGESVKANFAVENSENINSVKIQARGEAADTVSSVAIDNFVFGYPYTVKAGENVSLKKEEEYLVIEDGILTEEALSFRLLAEGAKSGDAAVTVFADGEETETVSAKTDADGNIDFTLSEALPSEANIKFYVDGGDWVLSKTIKNRVEDIGVLDISYKVGSVDVYTMKQLEEDSTLDATFNLYNRGEDREAVLVCAVYEGNKTVSLKTKKVSVPAEGTVETISVQLPEEDGEYIAECYLFDSLTSHKPLSKIWFLK